MQEERTAMYATIVCLTKGGVVEGLTLRSANLDLLGFKQYRSDSAQYCWYDKRFHGMPLLIRACEFCTRLDGVNVISVVCAPNGERLGVFTEMGPEDCLGGAQAGYLSPRTCLVVCNLYHNKKNGSLPEDYKIAIFKLKIVFEKDWSEHSTNKEALLPTLKKSLLGEIEGDSSDYDKAIACYAEAIEALRKKHRAEIMDGCPCQSFFCVD